MSDHIKKISYGCILRDKDDTIFFDLSLDSIPDEEEKAKLYKSLKVSSKKVIQRLKENEVDQLID